MPDDEEATRVNLFRHAENVRVFQSPNVERRLPVTIVTGFLGAGKTTLLHHILTNRSNLRIAAAINDFSALNIDENLVQHSQQASRLVELSNGCVCCHLLDDLQAAVYKMLEIGGDVDVDAVNYLVVETSGVSDPFAIIRTLDANFGKCFRARLDSVVTVVDADQMMYFSSGRQHHPPTISMSQAAVAQLRCADVVIVNKVDLLEDREKECTIVEEQIRAINEDAVIHRARHCQVPLSAILDVHIPPPADSGNAITHEASRVPLYVSTTGGALRCPSSFVGNMTTKKKTKSGSTTDISAAHLKADEFVSVSASVSEGPLLLSRLEQFVCSEDSAVRRLTRMKGVLWIQDGSLEEYRCVLHLSGRGRLGFELDGKWTGPPVSDMAFIGPKSKLNEPELLRSMFEQCCCTYSVCHSSEEVMGGDGLDVLRRSKEFHVLDNDTTFQSSEGGRLEYFRLTGSEVYGYSEEEIERDLRIDTDAMNMDLADAVNASVDDPKAFLVYTKTRIVINGQGDERSKVVLCYSGGEPANNLKVLRREAMRVLSTHFRKVQVCKCGA